MTLTVTDLFCGAGGSSTGLLQVPGFEVIVASNHWQLALDTHGANHPQIDHKRADIHSVDPLSFPRTEVLWASPECTNHSQAQGRKRIVVGATADLFGDTLPEEAAERSRATMWDVPRFAERHTYQAVITENVVDAARWVMFPAWLQAMTLLGYRHRIVYANSMHAQAGGLPAPQSRDRMYVVFWRAGNRAPDLDRWTRPSAYCETCGETVSAIQSWKRPDRTPWGRYRAQYVWRCPHTRCRNSVLEPGWLPAASAIDWTLPGERIGDRAKPLAAKTIGRIRTGLAKFYTTTPPAGPATATPARTPGLLVPTGGTWRDQARSLCEPMSARTTRDNDALLVPVEGRDGKEARPASEVLRTMTCRNETGLLMPYYGTGQARPVSEPVGTLMTRDRYAFVLPLRNNNTAKAIGEPFDTFAAAGNHHAMVTPAEERVRPVPVVEDCVFRMLEPHEIAAGMAFPAAYRILGNKRERVRQAGNAVTPPVARDLGYAVAESLGVNA